MSPIIRHGYATARRNGSTRAHRKLRAQVLAAARVCAVCGQPPTVDDPLTLGHRTPHSQGGPLTLANSQAEHASCNKKLGATPH